MENVNKEFEKFLDKLGEKYSILFEDNDRTMLDEFIKSELSNHLTAFSEETNNGWIKIESEEQFDKIENGNYHWYNIETEQWNDGDLPTHGKYTHYQPITKPNPPIF